MSSAHRPAGVVEFKHSGRSLMYNRNNRGPSIEPWGTPPSISFARGHAELFQNLEKLYKLLYPRPYFLAIYHTSE